MSQRRLTTVDLKQRLKQAGMTQTQLAKRLDVNTATVNRWCKIRQVPHYRTEAVYAALTDAKANKAPRTKIMRDGKPFVRKTVNQDTDKSHLNGYRRGYAVAMKTVSTLLAVPTNDTTKLKLLASLTSASEAISPSK